MMKLGPKRRAELKWAAQKRHFGSILTGILKSRVRIEDATNGELGYTYGQKGVVYLAKDHPFYEQVTEAEKEMIQLGIGVHEVLHCLFSNFDYEKEKYDLLSDWNCFKNGFEAEMFLDICNLVEDPAIENMASTVTGGVALKALYFAIEKTYELSGDVSEECRYPMEEMISALLQFGDLGIVKGEFHYPETKTKFAEIAPKFYEAINCTDGKRRVDLSYEIFDACRPLWENTDQAKQHEMMEKLKELLRSLQKGSGLEDLKKTGEGTEGKNDADSALNRRRRITIKKVTREEYEKAKEEAKDKPAAEDDGKSNMEILIPEDLNENDLKPGEGQTGNDASVPMELPNETPAAEKQEQQDQTGGNVGTAGEGQDTAETEKPAGRRSEETESKDPDSTGKEDCNQSVGNATNGDSEEKAGAGCDQNAEASAAAGDETAGSEKGDVSEASVQEAGSTGESADDEEESEHPESAQAKKGKAGGLDRESRVGSLDNTKDFNKGPSTTEPEELTEEEQSIYDNAVDFAPEVSAEDAEVLLHGIKREEDGILEEMEEADEYFSEIDDFEEELSEFPDFARVPAENRHVSSTESYYGDLYDQIVEQLSEYIEPFSDQIHDIFETDRVKKVYSDSGKIHLPRLATTRTTTVFRRRIQPDHKNDVCFCIAVDNSGSTGGEKNLQEKYGCIGIAEALAENDIPLYVFGFNTPSGKAVQTHYIRWENTRYERERLIAMQAGGCNFDSYAIRYATELLKEREERNKILIIISDGCPSFWFTGREGINQNRSAVDDAREEGIHVLGVGVGNVDDEEFARMYGKEYYLPVQKPADLFDNLADRIVRFIDQGA